MLARIPPTRALFVPARFAPRAAFSKVRLSHAHASSPAAGQATLTIAGQTALAIQKMTMDEWSQAFNNVRGAYTPTQPYPKCVNVPGNHIQTLRCTGAAFRYHRHTTTPSPRFLHSCSNMVYIECVCLCVQAPVDLAAMDINSISYLESGQGRNF